MARRMLKFIAYLLFALLVSRCNGGDTRSPTEQRGAPCLRTCRDSTRQTHCLSALKSRYRPLGPPPFPDGQPLHPAQIRIGPACCSSKRFSPGPRRARARRATIPACPGAMAYARAIGDRGTKLPLRSPTLIDIAWLSILGWDGKFPGLEEVTFVADSWARSNMDLDEPTAIARIIAVPGVSSTRLHLRLATPASIVNGSRQPSRPTSGRCSPAPPRSTRWVDGDESCGQRRLPSAVSSCSTVQGQLRGLPFRLGVHRRLLPRYRLGQRDDDIGRGTSVPELAQASLCLQSANLARRSPAIAVHARRVDCLTRLGDRSLQSRRDRAGRAARPRSGRCISPRNKNPI